MNPQCYPRVSASNLVEPLTKYTFLQMFLIEQVLRTDCNIADVKATFARYSPSSILKNSASSKTRIWTLETYLPCDRSIVFIPDSNERPSNVCVVYMLSTTIYLLYQRTGKTSLLDN